MTFIYGYMDVERSTREEMLRLGLGNILIYLKLIQDIKKIITLILHLRHKLPFVASLILKNATSEIPP